MPFRSSKLAVESSDGRNFTLLEDLVFDSKSGVTYTAPAGSQTDGASTPAFLWPTIPPFGPYWLAAVLHDWAYRYSQVPKGVCDDLLLEAMESLGVNKALSDAIYEGVHWAGMDSFDTDRANQKALG